MANITVVHYLNKKLKPTKGIGEYKDELAYPVYIRISYGRKNQRIKSCWIHFDVTEREFETDRRVKEVIEYESSIIFDMFKYQKDDSFDINTKLKFYLNYLIGYYVGSVLDTDKIVDLIRSYICEKADIKNEQILFPYISSTDIEEYDSAAWYELSGKSIFDNKLNNRVLYLALLLDFQSLYYKNDTKDYEVGKVLTYHEWENRGAKDAFIQFAADRHIIDTTQILEITQILDECLRSLIHDNWIILADNLRNCEKK